MKGTSFYIESFKGEFPVTATSQHRFELVFEGPVDASPDTIRRLKAALIVDLNLSIEKAQEVLSSAPTLILTSPSELELQAGFKALKEAGGKVQIVKNGGPPPHEELLSTEEEEEEEITFIKVKKEPPLQEEPEVEFEFSFEEDEPEPPPTKETKPTPVTPPTPKIEKKKEVTYLSGDENQPLFSFMSDAETPAEDEDLSIIPKSLRDKNPDPSKASKTELSLSFDEEPKETHVPASPVMRQHQAISEELAISFDIEEEKAPPPPQNTEPSKTEEPTKEPPPPAHTEEPPAKAITPEPTPPSADVPLGALRKKTAPPLSVEKPEPVTQTTVTPVSTIPSQPAVSPEPVALTPPPTETPHEAAITSNKPKARAGKVDKTRFLEWILPVLLGVIVLTVGNYWLTLQQASTPQGLPFEQLAQSFSGTQQSPSATEQKPARAGSPRMLFIGRQQYENRTLDGDFSLTETENKISATFGFETPPPPELSKEQIGRRERQAPWVRKIEVDKTTYDLTATGAFEGQAPARIYLEDGSESQRLVATAKINGSVTKERDVAVAEVRINYRSENETGTLVVKRKGEGDYSIVVSGEITARRVAE